MTHCVTPLNTVIPSAHRLTQKSLQIQSNWTEWLASECEQLNQYDKQGMFGHPCIPPPGAAIFHWVWIYKSKRKTIIARRHVLFLMALPIGAMLKLEAKHMHPLLT
jgi:hypothetical protein